jgi:hypothetical protein
VDAHHSLEFEGGGEDLPRFQRRMLERFLTGPHAVSREDLDYLLDKIDQLTAEMPAAQAA